MVNDTAKVNYTQLKNEALALGAGLFGVADISRLKPAEFLLSPETVAKYPAAISLACRLSQGVLDTLEDGPNRIYFQHYRTVNHFLDQLALRLSNIIQTRGGQSLPIAASQLIDWEKQRGHLSHKKVAWLAGLGWIGRSNLLVTPQFGSQVRLATILTDLPLTTSKPLDFGCGSCRACLEVCPVGAIKEKSEEFDHLACYEKLKDFRNRGLTDQFICGLCQKICPGTAH